MKPCKETFNVNALFNEWCNYHRNPIRYLIAYWSVYAPVSNETERKLRAISPIRENIIRGIDETL